MTDHDAIAQLSALLHKFGRVEFTRAQRHGAPIIVDTVTVYSAMGAKQSLSRETTDLEDSMANIDVLRLNLGEMLDTLAATTKDAP